MVFDNMEFHNVEAMVPYENGYKMCRLPLEITKDLDYGIRDNTSFMSTGVEIRFVMVSEEIKLHLCVSEEKEAQVAMIYFGAIQGGWQYSSKTIGTGETIISIRYPEGMEMLEEMSRAATQPFAPRLVRVILPYGTCCYLGKEGDTKVPGECDVPQGKYLAYGSSITHGSLAFVSPCNYVNTIARHFGVDAINQGYAGSAFMEKAMAEYIVNRKDWTFASVELGINMIKKPLSDEDYEERIKAFLDILATDSRPIFVTDIFTHLGEGQERSELFRDIVRRNVRGSNLIYTPGKDLLANPAFVSADLVHPTYEGEQQIAANWIGVMEAYGIGRECGIALATSKELREHE